MNFGPCSQCKTYKYLKEEATCPTCLRDDEGWVVVYVSPHGPDDPEVYKEELTEEKAYAISQCSPRLEARHESSLED